MGTLTPADTSAIYKLSNRELEIENQSLEYCCVEAGILKKEGRKLRPEVCDGFFRERCKGPDAESVKD